MEETDDSESVRSLRSESLRLLSVSGMIARGSITIGIARVLLLLVRLSDCAAFSGLDIYYES